MSEQKCIEKVSILLEKMNYYDEPSIHKNKYFKLSDKKESERMDQVVVSIIGDLARSESCLPIFRKA